MRRLLADLGWTAAALLGWILIVPAARLAKAVRR